MKKWVLYILMIVCATGVYAQKTLNSKDKASENIQKKMELFCEYVEKVGTTNAVSMDEKDKICKEKVPALFVNYENRYMRTSSGVDGKIIRQKRMSSYFENLKRQSASINRQIEYKLEFDVFDDGNEGEILWEYRETDKNEVKEYWGYVKIKQLYVVRTIRNGEVVYKYHEGDEKIMKVIKRVAPNGIIKVGLGDVTNTERISQGKL